MIKLCCYVMRSTGPHVRLTWGPVDRITYLTMSLSAPATDSPREVWWTASSTYTVSFSSRDVKVTKFNQRLPVVLTSLNVFIARIQKLVMFWMWRHRGTALWCHGGGAWHNGLFLTTASNVNCSADVANHVTQSWQAGDTENFERRITG